MKPQSQHRHAEVDVRHFVARKKPMRLDFVWFAAALALIVTGCEHKPTKEEEEATKNTITCQLAGERLVIRFGSGEARMLTAASEKITLYQIPSGGGTRYSNGNVELQGKGMDWTLTELGASTTLESCKQYAAPTKP
jgi:membrane-bound inhibitor of C-type lysozyme